MIPPAAARAAKLGKISSKLSTSSLPPFAPSFSTSSEFLAKSGLGFPGTTKSPQKLAPAPMPTSAPALLSLKLVVEEFRFGSSPWLLIVTKVSQT